MVQVHEQRILAAPPERVFDWLLDPANLTMSPWFRQPHRWTHRVPVSERRGKIKGFGWWVHERITAYDAPRSCSYRMVGGFRRASRRHTDM